MNNCHSLFDGVFIFRCSGRAGYKYRDVVRKKAEREQLQGFTCPDCEGFFRAVLSWDKNAKLPTCDHGRGVQLKSLEAWDRNT